MKALFTKFKILNCLDQGAALPNFWRKRVRGTPELERYAKSARRLDERLRQPAGPGPFEPPADLQADIMREVRRAQSRGPAGAEAPRLRQLVPGLRWGLAAALVLGVGLAASLALHWTGHLALPPGGRQARGPLPTVAPLVEQVASSGAAVLSRPMNRQLEDLSRDLRETAQFLLASVP